MSPTFLKVVDKIRTYFNMDIQATRFNWYRDSSDWKPYHHDAAAMKVHMATKQNITIAVSFGVTVCIEMDEFCMRNDGFCSKNGGFCI